MSLLIENHGVGEAGATVVRVGTAILGVRGV